MESDQAENRSQPANARPEYPEPSRTSYTPYPVLPNSAYPSFPGSAYGAFPGSYKSISGSSGSQSINNSGGFRTYGAWPASAPRQASPLDASGLTGSIRHVTDFRSFGGNGASPSAEPPHLAPVVPLPLTEIQRLAQQFHVRHGDPGSSARSERSESSEQWPRPLEEGGESRSHLAGIYQPDIGGKAAAKRAFAAAQTHGGQFEWDPDFEPEERDPDLEDIFAGTDIGYSNKAAGPQRRLKKGRGGWRKMLQGTEHEDVGRRSKSSGRGRGSRGKRGRGRGRGKAIDPGREFKNFLAEANKAYLGGDYAQAADNARQAIQANPEVYQAHALLATSLERQGRHWEAAQSMQVGALTARDPEVWAQVADKLLQLAGDDQKVLRQAADCYSEGLRRVKDDPDVELDIRCRALTVYEQLNDVRLCRLMCKHILRDFPLQIEYVQRYAVLCVKWQDHAEIAKAKEYYEKAFEMHKGDGKFDNTDDPAEIWTHLNIYLEMHDIIGKPVDGVVACKRIARWFLGRKEETFWDRYALDDREFDKDNARRNYVGEFQQGRASRDPNEYGDGLPIDIRVRLGLFRLKMGVEYHDEALRHFNWLFEYENEVDECYDLFVTVGHNLRDCGQMKEAARYYDVARTMTDADHPDCGLGEQTWMQIASCFHILGRIDDAMTSFENVRRRKGQKYNQACARLAKLYEDSGQTEKARFLCNELITLNRRELLYEAQVKMIPPALKSKKPALPPPAPKALPPPLPPPPPAKPLQMKPLPPPRPLKQLTAIEPAVPNDVNAEAVPLGPLSQPVVMPPMPAESLELGKKKQRGKKRGILSTICGEFDEPVPAGQGKPDLKRPRLKRKYTRKSDTLQEQERYRLLQDAQSRTHEKYALVQALWPVFYEGADFEAVEQWTDAAHAMLDEFKAMKVFFPDRDQYVKLKATEEGAKKPFLKDFSGRDLERDGPKQFLGIAFRDWQRVFVDLALLYVRTGEQDRCYKVVQEVLGSANVFYQDPELNQISYGTAIHVGLAFNDGQYLIQLARQVISSKPSDYRNSMGFQLFAAVARFSYGSNWFISGPTQKFMLRMVKQSDFMAMDDEQRKRVDWSAQGPSLVQRAQNYPKEDAPDAHILTMYGHMVAAANHSFSALPYYYRALALQPDNICIHLSIATMWIRYSMKRQVNNRQEGITTGLSFLYRYYDLRIANGSAGHIQEAEYNVARMWHYLGLTHLAIPAYEKVLQLSEKVQAEKFDGDVPLEYDVEDYAQEAAFALQNLFCLVGNEEAARAITEKWLVI